MPPDPLPRVPAGASRQDGEGGGVRYAETLRVPLRWWALATSFHATVLVAFAVALPLWVAVVAVAVLVVLSTAWFVGYGSARVVVTDDTFRAGRARVPVTLLADPRALDAEETWQAVGPQADARAYLLLRPYVRESVMVQLVDPADPAPYWLVSSRRPGPLVAALTAVVTADVAPRRAPGRGPGVSRPGHGAEWAEPDPTDPARSTD